MFTLCSSPNHISIKYNGPIKKSSHFRTIHSAVYTVHDRLVIFSIWKEPTR